jgi:hypothetical protein
MWLAEAVFVREPSRPGFDIGGIHLHRLPAPAANEVMVV